MDYMSKLKSFGSVIFNNNSNLKVDGVRNKGEIENNGNLKIQSTDSVLTLKHNVNTKLDVQKSQVVAFQTSNSKVGGTGNSVSLKNDVNVKLNGDRNSCSLDSNSNFQLTGSENISTFTGNRNTIVVGNGNQIEARDNNNLRVSGESNRVTVTGTNNHHLQPASEPNNRTNVVEIHPVSSPFMYSFLNIWKARDEEKKTLVSYVNEASINYNDYSLGIFKFVKEQNEKTEEIVMKFHARDFEQDSLKIKDKTTNYVSLTAKKKDEIQDLKIVGRDIKTVVNESKITVFVNSFAAAGI